jgi:putative acetyltransferase
VNRTITLGIEIRQETPEDSGAIRDVVRSAFPSDVEARLVDLLRARGKASISLVASHGNRIVGHALFSPITIVTCPDGFRGLGLAPVAVQPEFQNQGIGSNLIREGLAQCREGSYDVVVVLGHPRYYTRFGFMTASSYGLENEYGAVDAFMVLALKEDALGNVKGLVRYAPEFRETGC